MVIDRDSETLLKELGLEFYYDAEYLYFIFAINNDLYKLEQYGSEENIRFYLYKEVKNTSIEVIEDLTYEEMKEFIQNLKEPKIENFKSGKMKKKAFYLYGTDYTIEKLKGFINVLESASGMYYRTHADNIEDMKKLMIDLAKYIKEF